MTTENTKPQTGNLSLSEQNQLVKNARIFSNNEEYVLLFYIEKGQNMHNASQYIPVGEFMSKYSNNLATKDDLKELRIEIKTEMREFKSEIRAEMTNFKAEIRADISNFRGEMKDFKEDVGKAIDRLRLEIYNFRTEIKNDMQKGFEDSNRKAAQMNYLIGFLIALSVALPIISTFLAKG